MKIPRIHGVDLGYGILLMIVVALGTATAQLLPLADHLKDQFNLFFDGGVAALLFLNAFLMSKKALMQRDVKVISAIRKQSCILIIVGFTLNFFHPCTPILLLGMSMLIGSFLARLNTQFIALSFITCVILSLYLVIGQNMGHVTDSNFLIGGIKNALYKGYFGFIQWYPFYALGMIASRFTLTSVRAPSVLFGTIFVAIGLFIDTKYQLSLTLSSSVEEVLLRPSKTIFYPGFVFFGAGVGLIFCGIFTSAKTPVYLIPIGCLGTMRYSILILAGIVQVITTFIWPRIHIDTFIVYNIVLWSILIPACLFWKKQFSLGPVERVFRIIFQSS